MMPVCVWLTGLSGAGKSTIAASLTERIGAHRGYVTLLDGDAVRAHLSKGLGFSKADRDTNVRRIAFVAGEIVRHGGVVVCATISPYDETREQARAMVGPESFVLVHVATPLTVCERRDAKGLYARARRGDLAQFTGVDDPYEPPAAPDLVLDTTDRSVDDCAAAIERILVARGLLAAPTDQLQ